MSKRDKIILGVVALAVAGYFAFRWWKNRQDSGNDAESPTGGLGTNLNSVAPELVGGSSGPEVGPAVSMPLTINLSQPAQPAAPPEDHDDDDDMDGRPHHRKNPVQRQRHLNPGGPMIPPGEDTGGDEDMNPGGPGVFAGGEM